MSVTLLNNVATTDNYNDATTVDFRRGRQSFTMSVFNQAIFYQIGILPPAGRGEPSWEPGEHHLSPSLSNFTSAEAEGFPPGSLFAGVRVRSAVAGNPGRVTVA